MTDQVDSSSLGRVRPIRTCVGCRKRAPQAALLRVVAVSGSAGMMAVLDREGWQSGRGAYLHPSTRCFTLAEDRRALPRALRLTVALDLRSLGLEIEGAQDLLTADSASAESAPAESATAEAEEPPER